MTHRTAELTKSQPVWLRASKSSSSRTPTCALLVPSPGLLWVWLGPKNQQSMQGKVAVLSVLGSSSLKDARMSQSPCAVKTACRVMNSGPRMSQQGGGSECLLFTHSHRGHGKEAGSTGKGHSS